MRPKALILMLAALVVGPALALFLDVAADHGGGPGPRPLSGFQLSDHRGEAFGRDELLGRWTLVFFGYTGCPDICPTTLLTLREVRAELAKSGLAVPQVVLVSVDPERDDAETLSRYMAHFGAGFLGVRGDQDELRRFALQMGAMYARDPADANGSVGSFAHSSSVFLVDPQARMYAAFAAPHEPAAIAKRVLNLRERYEQS